MNKVDVQQAGGFPLETDTLNAMQTAYEMFNSLGALTAPLGIIKGCAVIGSNVGNGVVHINNEVLEFRGGAISPNVIIKEETATRNFENGETKIVYRMRYATFGQTSSGVNYPWAEFHRSLSNKELAMRCNHVGFVQLYSGTINSIPAGWYLCDGANGTPDLRSKFIAGYDSRNADYNAIGKTGGLERVGLTVNQLPKHKHNGSTSTAGDHYHNGLMVHGSNNDNGDEGPYIVTSRLEPNGYNTNKSYTTNAGAHTHSIEISEVGNNETHENRPPYYVLAYIIYKG